MSYPCLQTYALRLTPGPAGELAGVIEHVLSGERQRFASEAELLAALRALQRAQTVSLPPTG